VTCPTCGADSGSGFRFCVECGAPLASAGPGEERGRWSDPAVRGTRGGVPDVSLRRWNWGAFVFTWLWGLFNGAYLPLLGLLVGLVPSMILWQQSLPGGGKAWVSTSTLLYTAWSAYCGVRGDTWAWRGRTWRSVEQFRRSQHNWAVASSVAAIVVGAVVVVVLAASTAGLMD